MRKIIKGLSKTAFAVAFTFVIMGASNTTAKATEADFDAHVIKTQNAHTYTLSNGKFKDSGSKINISTRVIKESTKSGYYKVKGKNYWVKSSDCTDVVKFHDLKGTGVKLSTESVKKCDVYYIPTTKGNYTKKTISKGHGLGIVYEATNHNGVKFYVTEKETYIEPANVNKALMAVSYGKEYDKKLHYTQGKAGYIGKRYLGPDLDSILMTKVGTSWGVDCSSFCYSIYNHLGVSGMPNTTANYASNSVVKEVPLNKKQPGDILWRSGHVELYIGGTATVGAHGCYGGDHKGDVTINSNGANVNGFTKAYRVFN